MFNSARNLVTAVGIITIPTVFTASVAAADTIREGILWSKFTIPTQVSLKGQQFNIGETTQIPLGFKVKVGESVPWTAKPKNDSYINLLPKEKRFTSCAGKSTVSGAGEILVEWSITNCKKP